MGRSIRSKRIRKNKAALKVRYAARHEQTLAKTIAGLPTAKKDEEMVIDGATATEAAPMAEPVAPSTDKDGDADMAPAVPILSKSAIKKRRAAKSLKNLKRKGINPKNFNF